MSKIPTPKDDGLYISDVGEWSHDKHFYLKKYIDAFTTSMRKKWSGLHYIDLFAGSGLERLKDSKRLEWGSPMIAAHARFKFTRLHLCEKDEQKYESLTKRINSVSPNAQIINGDANEKIHEIVKQIPSETLSLAFLDPYGLHLAFETLQVLQQNRVDLIIFFPDYLDAMRNWEKYYLDNPESNLDSYLGPASNWRDRLENIPQHRRAEELRAIYVDQIKSKLGYTKFDYERISAQGHPLYSLIFCSRHPFAAKLWREITYNKPNGQKTFKFE